MERVLDLTVIVPTYNRFDRLPRLLKSISQQSILPKEVIVVDDGSSQKPSDEELRSLLPDSVRFQFLKNEENRGPCARRNQGAKLAQTKFVTFVDDDDYWLETYLSEVNTLMQMTPKEKCVYYSSGFVEDENGQREIRHHEPENDFSSEILKINFILSPGVIVPLNLFWDSGGFDESLPSSQDWDLWVRLSQLGEFYPLTEPHVVHVDHSDARISNSIKRHFGYRSFYQKHLMKILKSSAPLKIQLKAVGYSVIPARVVGAIKSLVH